jgi:hypothetical protein
VAYKRADVVADRIPYQSAYFHTFVCSHIPTPSHFTRNRRAYGGSYNYADHEAHGRCNRCSVTNGDTSTFAWANIQANTHTHVGTHCASYTHASCSDRYANADAHGNAVSYSDNYSDSATFDQTHVTTDATTVHRSNE